MIPTIKILNTTGRWANIKYTASNARSRQNISRLIEDYNKGILNIENPQLLPPKK